MVVDACFIASQIDVWTQAYNGPTSRRKYVLNLLNVLHKNVTEEYKTDQFLHVIYWFLIYKSNLGHFFRNEGMFPPLFYQVLHAQTSPAGQVPTGTASFRTCKRAQVWACSWQAAWTHTLGILGSCRPWVEETEWSLLHPCDLPCIWSWKSRRRAAERFPWVCDISQASSLWAPA